MGLMKSDTSYEGLVASKWQLASLPKMCESRVSHEELHLGYDEGYGSWTWGLLIGDIAPGWVLTCRVWCML